MSRLFQAVTGAREGEHRQVTLAFFALLFLMVSYYIIKPLRDSQFLKEFDANTLPLIYLVVPVLSFVVTKIFNFLADRYEKYRLIIAVYIVIMSCKCVFNWLLSTDSKSAVVAFFFFASVYFLLALSTLWACINDMFTVAQGERCFGFVAMGSTVGSIVGSEFSIYLSKSDYRSYAALFSALSMGVALSMIMIAARERRAARAQREAEKKVREREEVPETGFWADVRELLARPYVRRIGVMVMILAVFTTSLDFVSKRIIDEGVTRQQVEKNFPELSKDDFWIVHKLKVSTDEEREAQLKELAVKCNKTPEEMKEAYGEFREDLEASTREVISNIYLWQGILGIFLLLVVARIIFAYFGLRVAVLVLPVVALISLATLAVPVELLVVQVVVVVAGAANYSLNNAAKEVLYTATDEETKFKHKPLIEGPGMRIGDQGASIMKLFLLGIAAKVAWSDHTVDQIFLGIAFLMVLIWARAIYLAAKEYDLERKQRSLEDSGE